MTQDSDEVIVGFMCRTDWEYEFGSANDGNRVFPSKEALEKEKPCVFECGIVQVEVKLIRVVRKGKL